MALSDYDGSIVTEGHWLYDGAIPHVVHVVAFDCDYFRDRMPGDDGRDSWEEPHPLNSEGVLYYLSCDGDVLPLKPFISIEDAKRWANAQPWAPIIWQDVKSDA